MYQKFIITSALVLVVSPPAQAFDCEVDARAAMLDVAHPVPMRQDVTTEMAGQKIKSAALSTPDGRGMSLDASGKPVSLWSSGRFYTSSDGGDSWTLLSEQTEEAIEAQHANLAKQAEQATDISCEYGVELEDRTVNRFSLTYTMLPSGTPATSTYWIDVETSFPWKVVHDFKGASPSTITQLNSPDPSLRIADPGG